MKKNNNNHDEVVQQSILRYLDLLEKNNICLFEFVNIFEALVRSTESKNLRAFLFEKWIDFESINASMLDEERESLDEEDKKIIKNLIDQIKFVIPNYGSSQK